MTADEAMQVVLASPELMRRVNEEAELELGQQLMWLARDDPRVTVFRQQLQQGWMTPGGARLVVWFNILKGHAKLVQIKARELAAEIEGSKTAAQDASKATEDALRRWNPGDGGGSA